VTRLLEGQRIGKRFGIALEFRAQPCKQRLLQGENKCGSFARRESTEGAGARQFVQQLPHGRPCVSRKLFDVRLLQGIAKSGQECPALFAHICVRQRLSASHGGGELLLQPVRLNVLFIFLQQLGDPARSSHLSLRGT